MTTSTPDSTSIDPDRLLADHGYLKDRLLADLPGVAAALNEHHFPLVDRGYVVRYLEHIRRDHLENPLAPLYIRGDLGAPGRQVEFVRQLTSAGLDPRGKSCLDVGCNNGALAVACDSVGARRVMAVDINEHRLASARIMCRGRPIDVLRVNVLEEELQERFQVILCTDVIEHVPDPALLIRRLARLLDGSQGSFICISLHNYLHPASVLSEPHFSVPGMTLLPREEASRLWEKVCERYQSKLEYDVFHWHSYWEYAEMAREAGLRTQPLGGHPPDDAMAAAVKGYGAVFDRLEVDVERKLRESPLTLEERAPLESRIREYLDTARREHEACLGQPSSEVIRRLYFEYHWHLLVMVMDREPRRGWRAWFGR